MEPPAADLDEAFSDFLKEIGDSGTGSQGQDEVAGADDAGTSKPSAPKRARQDEGREISRAERAQRLRKASYLGELVKVERTLSRLPVAERLLLIDDLDPDDGFAALHLAVIRGHAEVAKKLIAYRADVDVLTRDGDTPLLWAAHNGSLAICTELLRAGADASIKNKSKTAAIQAKVAGHRRVHDLLENHACDVAVGLRRTATSKEKAAAARRAANAAMVAQALQDAKEREEDEAFWAGVRNRRAAAGGGGGDEDSSARAAYLSDQREEAQRAQRAAAAAAKLGEEEALAALPPNVRAHYRLFGLMADAVEVEVRRAYRQLALKHHPDKNPEDAANAKAKFTEIAVAYEAVCQYLATLDADRSGTRIAPPQSY